MPSQTTYSSSDWEVWSYKPVTGKFILDFSQLDDATAPLSATEGTVEIVDASITGITVSEGSQPNSGIFFDPTPSRASVTLEIKNFTKSDSTLFYPGTDLWITFKNGESYNNSYLNLGKRTPIFFGKTTTFNVEVQPDSDFAQVTVDAQSIVFDELNTLMIIDTSSGLDKHVAIENAASALGFYADLVGSYGFYSRGNQTKTYGDWLNELVLTGQNLPADNCGKTSQTGTETSPVITYQQGIRSFMGSHTGVIEHTFDETSINQISYDWVHSDAPTGVTLTNEGDTNLVYQRGTGGEGSLYLATVDLPSLTWMESVGNTMINYKKLFSPVAITTTLATDLQTITWGDYGPSGYPAYIYPIGWENIGSVVAITLAENGFTNEKTVITGRTIQVTPDNWNVTYNLWKGFSF